MKREAEAARGPDGRHISAPALTAGMRHSRRNPLRPCSSFASALLFLPLLGVVAARDGAPDCVSVSAAARRLRVRPCLLSLMTNVPLLDPRLRV